MTSEPHPESPASMLSVEQELLPCPFCGSDADVEHLENGRWSAGCVDPDGDCMGFQSLQTFPRKIVAINAWNTRHQSLSRSAGGEGVPTIDAPERREAVAQIIRDYCRAGVQREPFDGPLDTADLASDAILALLAASSGELVAWLYQRQNAAHPNLPAHRVVELDRNRWTNCNGWTETPLFSRLAPTPATVEEPKV